LVAEVDERRLVQPKGHGSSPFAPAVCAAGSSRGESAPEAGSRWRKPRAREQRHRWRAPRDPTRTARKRGARPGEGALGDGRRPGPAQAAVFDETAGEAGLAIRSDGDLVSRPDPRRIATEGVRGSVASSACGRKHRRRVVQRGGVGDRDPARTALRRSRGRSGPSPATRAFGCPFWAHVTIAAIVEAGGSPSSEAPPGRLVRKAEYGKAPEPRHRRANAQGESAHRLRGPQGTWGATRHREVERGSGRSREPSSPQGARDGSRLQKSVRRIFLVPRRKPGRWIARSDPSAFDEADQGSRRATGCGARQCT